MHQMFCCNKALKNIEFFVKLYSYNTGKSFLKVLYILVLLDVPTFM